MAGKDFSAVGGGRVYAEIEQSGAKRQQQGTASPEEQERRKAEGKTQGRKGCKAPRINLAFTTENHQFIKLMSKATGHTMTEFTNMVIEAYRKDHPELTEQAKVFLDTVNSGLFSSDKREGE